MSFSFVAWATEKFNGVNFGMAGKTIGSLRRNVIGPLKQMLYSRGYIVVEHRTENYLTIRRGLHSNDFYLFGGLIEILVQLQSSGAVPLSQDRVAGCESCDHSAGAY
ncbi:hypothetical protein B9G55_01585 [Saccharibacillus sp. O16]|nr:hypothetical protein B9G55_01585 [Saccharibacillus sp. O16]